MYIKVDLRHNIIIVGFVSLAVSQTLNEISAHMTCYSRHMQDEIMR
jgi:hypothetical protein